MKYYYKNGDSTLLVKHQLAEEELGNWQEITEEEYKSIRARKNAEMRGEQV